MFLFLVICYPVLVIPQPGWGLCYVKLLVYKKSHRETMFLFKIIIYHLQNLFCYFYLAVSNTT